VKQVEDGHVLAGLALKPEAVVSEKVFAPQSVEVKMFCRFQFTTQKFEQLDYIDFR